MEKPSSVTFDLWADPWIAVLRPDGTLGEFGIRDALVQAHELRAIHETSPPLAAGIHRLLTAVVQACYDSPGEPLTLRGVAAMLLEARFDAGLLEQFGTRYGDRFDLFSADAPFLQTADAPLEPRAQDKPISIGHLLPEEPTGTNVAHFRHRYEEEHRFCPPCAARALVALPAFATAAGRGYRPSINGVPPLYVFPVGETLFRTLSLSLATRRFQPDVAADDADDQPWWEREPNIPQGIEVQQVGYLESLTFPARRVRLYPQAASSSTGCTRCGRTTRLTVSSMHFAMGLSRPKDLAVSAPWFDPFAAYRTSPKVVPVRLTAGKALWREYGTLFVTQAKDKRGTETPRIVRQIGALSLEEPQALRSSESLAFRCIGVRTDMKAKVFEWMDETLDEVPVEMLQDEHAQHLLLVALGATDRGMVVVDAVFRKWLAAPRPGPARAGRARNEALRQRMRERYWQALAAPFRDLVPGLARRRSREIAYRQWLDQVRRAGMAVIEEAVDALGEDAKNVRRAVCAVAECRRRLNIVISQLAGDAQPVAAAAAEGAST